MNKISAVIAAAIFSVSAAAQAKAAESKAIEKAGLSLSGIEVPAPETPKNNQWLTLRKITVNEAQPDMDNMLVGLIKHGENIDNAVKELNANGFKAQAVQDNLGGYMVMVDVTGQDAADQAVGLARYYYVTEVKVSRKVHNQLFGLNNKSTFAVKMGTIKGGMNHSPVDVTLNKLDWTITGGINLSPVDIKIDNDAKTITGGANHSQVDLKFLWSPEEVSVEGGANVSPVKYTVNWKNGLLEGYSNHAPLRLKFNMDEGNADATTVSIKGYATHSPVELTYNKVSGHISGGMGFSQVDVDLVNCDLYDFLQHFFLFLNETPA